MASKKANIPDAKMIGENKRAWVQFIFLKGRWQILKSGIQIQGVDAVDNIWLTCCALHNWLLEIDGLNAEWSEVSMPVSDWEGDLGDCDFEGINVMVPWSLTRLSQRLEP